MDDVFTFIKNGLDIFSDNGGVYDEELKNDCIILNKLLNKIEDDDYQKHLADNSFKIKDRAEILFTKMQPYTYTNLQEIFNLLFFYQNDNEIQDPYDPHKDIRDHYFHSLQCFLLSIVLYPVLINHAYLPPETSHIIGILFSLTMYHDIGYLYKIEKQNTHKINSTIRSLLFEDNELGRNIIMKILSVVLKDIISPYQEASRTRYILEKIKDSSQLKNIWKDDLNDNDFSDLQKITRIPQFPSDSKQHHSFMSAVFLDRILRTIRTIRQQFGCSNSPNIILTDNPDLIQEEQFTDIIRAILLHDIEALNPITLKNDFWAAFLIIVDELQTYGRLPQNNEQGKDVLNPKYVGFRWLNSSDKLLLTYNKEFVDAQANKKLSEAYKKHNNNETINNLKNKVSIGSLSFLNIDDFNYLTC